MKSSLTPDTKTMSESGASCVGGSFSMSRTALINESVSMLRLTTTALQERARILELAVLSSAQMTIT